MESIFVKSGDYIKNIKLDEVCFFASAKNKTMIF